MFQLCDSSSIYERETSGNRNGVVSPRRTWREMRAVSPRACVFIARLFDSSGSGSFSRVGMGPHRLLFRWHITDGWVIRTAYCKNDVENLSCESKRHHKAWRFTVPCLRAAVRSSPPVLAPPMQLVFKPLRRCRPVTAVTGWTDPQDLLVNTPFRTDCA